MRALGSMKGGDYREIKLTDVSEVEVGIVIEGVHGLKLDIPSMRLVHHLFHATRLVSNIAHIRRTKLLPQSR